MNVENHPLVRNHPELAEKLLERCLADGTFAQSAQRYAQLDQQLQAGNAQVQQEHNQLRDTLLEKLQQPAAASSCCGGCGGGGH